MSNVKTPPFVSDLYRDLRDRRLLIPAAALLVALVAVPVLITGGGSEPAPPPAMPVAAGDATEVESAVLVEETGVRDYRKRLAALKSQNPFEQKFAAPTPESVAIQEPAPTVSASSSGTSAGAATGLGDVTSSVSDSTSTTTDAISNSSSDTSSGAAEPAQPTRVVEQRFYAYRIDVAVGPLGEVKKLDDVRELDFLPSTKNAIVAFLGVDERGKKATFVLDDDVVGSRGDGRCLGGGGTGACQFLVLKAGQQRIFELGPGVPGQRLKLLDIDVVEVKAPKRKRNDG